MVQALDATTGAPAWQVDLRGHGLERNESGSLFASDGQVAFVGLRDSVMAFDGGNGERRFTIDRAGSQIWLDGATLYRALDERQAIAAFDATGGAHRWTYARPSDLQGYLGPFRTSGDALYAFCLCRTEPDDRNRGWLLAVETSTGRERWRIPVRAQIELLWDAPAITGGAVVLASEDGRDVVARSSNDGRERWRIRREAGRAAASDGYLVFFTDRAPRWRAWLALLNPAWR